MSFALFQSALYLPAELTLNRLLALDELSADRLAALEGKTLAVIATRPALAVYISVRNQRITLASLHEDEPTATISGSAQALAGLLLRHSDVSNLKKHSVELRGSTSVVAGLQTLFRSLDIDWEYHLARFLGDLPVVAISKGLAHSTAALKQQSRNLQDNLHDYLTTETDLLVDADRAEKLYADINALQLRTDRLQARLDLIKP